jgi:hypothetical protein
MKVEVHPFVEDVVRWFDADNRMNRSTAINATDAISTYILAKDSNHPQLMKNAFAGDCELAIVATRMRHELRFDLDEGKDIKTLKNMRDNLCGMAQCIYLAEKRRERSPTEADCRDWSVVQIKDWRSDTKYSKRIFF